MELNPFNGVSKVELNCKINDCGYRDLVFSIEPGINWKVVTERLSYQGELFFFGEMEGNYYYVTSDYGSCSGCDALEACNTMQEVLDLRVEIASKIRMFDSIQEFKIWFSDVGSREHYSNHGVESFIDEFRKSYKTKLEWRDL